MWAGRLFRCCLRIDDVVVFRPANATYERRAGTVDVPPWMSRLSTAVRGLPGGYELVGMKCSGNTNIIAAARATAACGISATRSTVSFLPVLL